MVASELNDNSDPELTCRLAGNLIYLTWSLAPSKRRNLESFFGYQSPFDLLRTEAPQSFGLNGMDRSRGTLTKTLLLEPAAPMTVRYVTAHGFTDGTNDLRSFLNQCGAKFPESHDWKERSLLQLDPMLRSRPPIFNRATVVIWILL